MEKVACYDPKASVVQGKKSYKDLIYKVVLFTILIGIWQIAATTINSDLLCPKPMDVFLRFFENIKDPVIIENVTITLVRVIKGFMWSMIIGVPLGLLMGLSRTANKLVGGLVDSVKQVPIMAWVPLTIIWLGIGDGPTIFLIAFSGLFPVILNTIHGVRNISPDYYHAARSMGGGAISVFKDVVIPSSIPDILTGARLAISAGWMSVI